MRRSRSRRQRRGGVAAGLRLPAARDEQRGRERETTCGARSACAASQRPPPSRFSRCAARNQRVRSVSWVSSLTVPPVGSPVNGSSSATVARIETWCVPGGSGSASTNSRLATRAVCPRSRPRQSGRRPREKPADCCVNFDDMRCQFPTGLPSIHTKTLRIRLMKFSLMIRFAQGISAHGSNRVQMYVATGNRTYSPRGTFALPLKRSPPDAFGEKDPPRDVAEVTELARGIAEDLGMVERPFPPRVAPFGQRSARWRRRSRRWGAPARARTAP